MNPAEFEVKENNNQLMTKFLPVFLVLFVILFFFRLGSTGLIDVDEPRYAEAGREMLESGNWIVPYFNYHIRFDKPVFYYWLEAVSMKIFGVNEFAARLPSVLSALLCAYFVFYILKTFYGNVSGMLGALILMSCFEFSSLSRFSVTDMTFSSFITCSLICFFLGYNQLSASHRFFKLQISEFSLWYILAFVFLGLAFLTKGPVSVVIFIMVTIPFFWWIGKLEYFYRSHSFWIGAFVFFLLALPWYVAVHIATSGEFTKVFFGFHNINRYTDVVSGHRGSVFYFFPVVLIGMLPWTFFLPQAINNIFGKKLKSLLISTASQLPWFCLWWFIIIFLFFSFSKTKLLTYILPLFPPLAVVVSLWFMELLNKQQRSLGLTLGLGIFFIFCLIVFYFCLFNLNSILPREVKSLKLDLHIIYFAFLMLVGISMAWASSNKNIEMTVFIILSTFLVLYYSFVGFLLPKIDRHAQFKLRKFATSFSTDVKIGTYKIIKPSLTFYSRRKIKKIDSSEKLQKIIDGDKKFAFVTKKKLLKEMNVVNVYKWGEDSRYVFFTNFPCHDHR
jgi:4-amino-4-deoxy-L-arabinose transferase-like glycosyltransferase